MDMYVRMEWVLEVELRSVIILKESLCYIEPLEKNVVMFIKEFLSQVALLFSEMRWMCWEVKEGMVLNVGVW